MNNDGADAGGKVAIVTGAGGALGAGIARGLAQEGAAVIVADVKVEAANEVAVQIRNEGVRHWRSPVTSRKRPE